MHLKFQRSHSVPSTIAQSFFPCESPSCGLFGFYSLNYGQTNVSISSSHRLIALPSQGCLPHIFSLLNSKQKAKYGIQKLLSRSIFFFLQKRTSASIKTKQPLKGQILIKLLSCLIQFIITVLADYS